MEKQGETRALVRLALPVAAAQLGWMTIGLVDIWMVGRLGAEALAAVSLGDLWIVGTAVIATGVIMGIDPIVSQAHGARLPEAMGRALQQGIALAVLLAVPLSLAWWQTGPVLGLLGQDPELSSVASDYVRAQTFCLAPFFIYIALRQYLQGRGMMLPPLVIVLVANVVNAVLNAALIFGFGPIPALGVRGAGIASGMTRVFMMLALAGVVLWGGLHRDAWTPWSLRALHPRELLRVLRYGIPVGTQIGLEVWAFTLCSVFAGWIGAAALAAHTIVLKVSAFSFMTAHGIGVASATRVGNLLGAGEHARAQRTSWIGIALGAGTMALFGLLFVAFRDSITGVFVGGEALTVIALGAGIFPIAAAFQIFDGTQVVAAGVLRGMGTTRPAAAINFVGYYLFALPVGAWLTFEELPFGLRGLGLGLPGLWVGLALGLGSVALLLLAWVWRRGPARVDGRVL